MEWTINQLHQLQNKGLEFDETVNLSELTKAHADLQGISPVKVVGRADISSNKVTFHLKISGTLILACARTLVDVNYPFEIETIETILFNSNDFEMDIEDTHHIEGDLVDLIPIIKENILLEIPMQVFSDDSDHKEDAAPQEGKDWQVVSEEENQNKIDPRLAGLADFFDDDKKS
ncbi:YceD family protein [Metabacillus arenae]|uniref:DUF177 domain-containing protein n=1 Tax=Metabacillus arenae TaxID=2771434 RepID=A0A926NLB7_9BACI|nr:DUF177 domain-containing protein [Metabacillus arenae]MBD1379911.1 DUF177 domain-containing protein [Metabacillus arenae]